MSQHANNHPIIYPVYINNFTYPFLGHFYPSTRPKPFSFPIQKSLYPAAFPLIILIDFPLNLLSCSCTQQMSTYLHSNISTISLDLSLRVPTFKLQTHKCTNLLSRWCNCWMTIWISLNLTLVLLCTASSLWKAAIPLSWFGLLFSLCLLVTS